MFNIFSFTKSITNTAKFHKDLSSHLSLGALYNFVNVTGDNVEIHFKQSLNQEQIDSLSVFVSAFSNTSVIDSLYAYLGATIDPFGEALMRKIRAENMAMGITQSGKTGEVLGFFNIKVFPNPNGVFPYSLEDAFESGSMYEIVNIIDYWLKPENVTQIAHLAPFITPERLTQWKIEIIEELT